MSNKIYTYYNAKCVNCQIIKEKMRRVGSIIFCPTCCDKIFKTDDPVKKERKKYLKFLKIQSDQALKEETEIKVKQDNKPESLGDILRSAMNKGDTLNSISNKSDILRSANGDILGPVLKTLEE